ncbi:hypothetical protein KR215_009100 [Drosophila sulfurigaster]|nr:hypothetical protein KR215_009100 [Drosophila sulfurigaster]
MEGKTLNLQLAENSECDTFDHYFIKHYDNQCVTNYKVENLTDVIQQQDTEIYDLKTKLSKLEMKAALDEEKLNLYKDKLKYKDDQIEFLKLRIESFKNGNNDNFKESNLQLEPFENNGEMFERFYKLFREQNDLIEILQNDLIELFQNR